MPPTELRLKTGFETSMAAGFGAAGPGAGGMPVRRSPRSTASYPYAQLKFQPNPFSTQPLHRVPATAAGIRQAKLGSFPESFFCRLVEQGYGVEDLPVAIAKAGSVLGDEAADELRLAYEKLAADWLTPITNNAAKAWGGIRSAGPKLWNSGKSMFGYGTQAAVSGADDAAGAAVKSAPQFGAWSNQAGSYANTAAQQAPKVESQIPQAAKSWGAWATPRVRETATTAGATGTFNAARESAHGDPNASWGEWGNNMAGSFLEGAIPGAASGLLPGQLGSAARNQMRSTAIAATGGGWTGEKVVGQMRRVNDMMQGPTYRLDENGNAKEILPREQDAANRAHDFDMGATIGAASELGRFGFNAFRNRGGATAVPGATGVVDDAIAAAKPVVDNVANGAANAANQAANTGWANLRTGAGVALGGLGLAGGGAILRDPSIIPTTARQMAEGASDAAAKVLKGPITEAAVKYFVSTPEAQQALATIKQFMQPFQSMSQFWAENKQWLAPMLLQSLIGAGGGYLAGGGRGMLAGMIGMPALVQGMQYLSPDSFGNPAIQMALKQYGLTGGDKSTLDTTQNNLVSQILKGLGWDSSDTSQPSAAPTPPADPAATTTTPPVVPGTAPAS